MIKGDASEILALAVGLQQAGVRAGAAIREPVLTAGEMIATVWRTGARMSSGAHGIHYPDAISAELVFDLGGVAVDIGPESGKPQGGMSFEHGVVLATITIQKTTSPSGAATTTTSHSWTGSGWLELAKDTLIRDRMGEDGDDL